VGSIPTFGTIDRLIAGRGQLFSISLFSL